MNMLTIRQRIRASQVWRSIFRRGHTAAERDRSLAISGNFFLHILPAKSQVAALRFTYSFYLGIISFVLFVILTVTGMLLMFYYVPSIERAYPNMVALATEVPFGLLLRNLHRWAAHAMVLAVWLHMLRVFYTGSYKAPRQFNWVIGVGLLILTLGLSFTGYLLPWDQLAFWAITVGTSIAGYAPGVGTLFQHMLLGGPEVGQNTLLRFYVLHVFLLPLLLTILAGLHFWRIRKDGGLSLPPSEELRRLGQNTHT